MKRISRKGAKSQRGEFDIEYPANSSVAIVRITGRRENNERAHVRIVFPGGDFEVVRATNDDRPDYWCHIRVNRPDDGGFIPGETEPGMIAAARLDIRDPEKHVSTNDLGDFVHPQLYHLAIRVRRDDGEDEGIVL